MSALGPQVSPTELMFHVHEVAGMQFGSVDRDTASIVDPVESVPLWASPSKTGRCRWFRREDLESTAALLRLRGREPRRPRGPDSLRALTGHETLLRRGHEGMGVQVPHYHRTKS